MIEVGPNLYNVLMYASKIMYSATILLAVWTAAGCWMVNRK